MLIYSPKPIEGNPLEFVQLSSVAELNQTQSNGLNLIGFNLLDWFRNPTHTMLVVQFGLIAELNQNQSTDKVGNVQLMIHVFVYCVWHLQTTDHRMQAFYLMVFSNIPTSITKS